MQKKQTKYIASCSFGKDSLAMILLIKKHKLPLDEVLFVEPMYSQQISGICDEQLDFINEAEKILESKYDLKITHLRAKKSFLEQFMTVKQKGNHIGDIYGFPYIIGSWCNSKLKIEPIRVYLSKLKKEYNIIQYIGIAYDEPNRYNRLDHTTHKAPLVDLKYTEKMCFDLCKQNNLLSPIYNHSWRDGCWFCPKQRLSQLKYLYKNQPSKWNELKRIEPLSHNTFKIGYTLTQLENRFTIELQQTTIYDFINY